MSTLTIELTPEQEKMLQNKAQQQGLEVPSYARALLIVALTQRTDAPSEPDKTQRSIMELEGLGAHIWQDENGQLIDAQQYVHELRSEWDSRF